MESRFDRASPSRSACTIRGDAKIDQCALKSYCPTCGFSAGEVERRKAMIRAGKMRIDPNGGARVIKEWPTSRYGQMSAETAALLREHPSLKTLFVREIQREENHDNL
ncbi:MAG: hypothetical protein LUE22_01535 [Oscillospiraceae bacterium]|nr:hypothetical protein [Oscillospiraceae bacterium]